MNRLEVIGHLGNDAEVKDLGNNQVINFSVAVSESYLNKVTNEKVTNTMWFECAKWGNNTSIAQYLKKGTQVYVSGKPNNRGWLNEQGEIKTVNGINVFDIQLLGSKQDNTQNQSNASTSTETAPIAPIINNDGVHDDLPF